MKENSKQLDKLITEALAIEARDAKEAGALGYMVRALVQATMPHRELKETHFERRNGAFSMSMIADPKIGLPYGSFPRLITIFVCTQAKLLNTPEIYLGRSMSEFLHKLGYDARGGKRGEITRLKKQAIRLFSSSIKVYYEEEANNNFAFKRADLADEAYLWWDPKKPEQNGLWESKVILSKAFFEECLDAVPVDIRVAKSLTRSPLAIDIYCWLTHRMSYLNKSTLIPWGVLQLQFGAEYADTSSGRQGFKRGFINALKKVMVFYAPKIVEEKEGIRLYPSKPHIKFICE